MNPRVSFVKYKPHHKLIVTFNNNEIKEFDLCKYLDYPVYEPLKDEAFCSKVTVKNGIVQWDDVIDIDPDIVYIESTPVLTHPFHV
ncbi:DUF2442 domain-containing protein [Pedobacter sp. BS3]|uniref:DUF2442 domain-containing protein n=1 Tax=Pedobacter sp. BS3 TaxID=2567937 RepID=UPI0011EC788D|nr:DUF2442 domain-containing protein [Pedobacter sp. BS3]TZF84490.1 DUF2442 domain-containing protein [Pedobacter sp. BS3]